MTSALVNCSQLCCSLCHV